MPDPEVTAAPSPEDFARLQTVAAEAQQAAQTPGTEQQKTEAVQESIKESAAQAFPQLSEAQLQELAEKLAPIVAALSVGPMTDGMIEKMQQLEVVFQQGQAAPAAQGTPEAAAQAEAAAAPDSTATAEVEPPRKKTWAERFRGED
jgi:hypothetical protein